MGRMGWVREKQDSNSQENSPRAVYLRRHPPTPRLSCSKHSPTIQTLPLLEPPPPPTRLLAPLLAPAEPMRPPPRPLSRALGSGARSKRARGFLTLWALEGPQVRAETNPSLFLFPLLFPLLFPALLSQASFFFCGFVSFFCRPSDASCSRTFLSHAPVLFALLVTCISVFHHIHAVGFHFCDAFFDCLI